LKNNKKCALDGCNNPSFGKFCKYHTLKKPLKSGGKLSPRKKSKEEIEENKQAIERMWNMFLEIWEERPHYCEETGLYLGQVPLSTMMHHILAKSKYPQYKYEKWNIALLHPDVHSQVETDITKTPKTHERYLSLLKSSP